MPIFKLLTVDYRGEPEHLSWIMFDDEKSAIAFCESMNYHSYKIYRRSSETLLLAEKKDGVKK